MSETHHTPTVNEVNEFLEIASDFENPLEAIREALSNSWDAAADRVWIEIEMAECGPVIVIEDDGHGMTRTKGLPSFFDLGNSPKGDAGIGYKGHGTKIFYKSDDIRVTTRTPGGPTVEARMAAPWETLNDGALPEYHVREVDDDGLRGETGTRIEIRGFRAGQGLDSERLTYARVHHYLKWKTVAGSTAHFFDEDFREMQVTVDLGGEIDDSRGRLVTDNRFRFPAERREPGTGEYPAERMCRHYPPRTIEAEYEGDDGETRTAEVEIVGMAGGRAARDELPTHGRHAAQFGVWLAKDHVKVERVNEAVSHDNEYIHFLFVANCQALELSANRETIRNKDAAVYDAVVEEVELFMSKVEHHPWFRETYMGAREAARRERRSREARADVKERIHEAEARDRLVPQNSVEVALVLDRGGRPVAVRDYDPSADAEAVVDRNGELVAAALCVELRDLLEDGRPLDAVDVVYCWRTGDPDWLAQCQRRGYLDREIDFRLDRGRVVWGDDVVEVIVLGEARWGGRLEAGDTTAGSTATEPQAAGDSS